MTTKDKVCNKWKRILHKIRMNWYQKSNKTQKHTNEMITRYINAFTAVDDD